MKVKWILILITILLVNCKDSEEDCSLVLCAEMGYSMLLTSTDSEENWLLENGYTEEDIQVLNSEDEEIGFSYYEGEIWVQASNSTHGMHTLVIDEIEISYSYDYTEPGSGCCDFGDLTEVTVTGYEFTANDYQIEIFL